MRSIISPRYYFDTSLNRFYLQLARLNNHLFMKIYVQDTVCTCRVHLLTEKSKFFSVEIFHCIHIKIQKPCKALCENVPLNHELTLSFSSIWLY